MPYISNHTITKMLAYIALVGSVILIIWLLEQRDEPAVATQGANLYEQHDK